MIISLCIFAVFELITIKIRELYEGFQYKEITLTENKDENIEIMKRSEANEEIKSEETEDIWQVEIPIINLKAPISEGTSQEVMLEFVGHFENTSEWNGNIGLAAHNRGYPINYFSKLKELEIGDEIIYKSKNGIKKYSVNLTRIIQDTDWSYLQETKENKITLITCVENEPSKRICVQGIEI